MTPHDVVRKAIPNASDDLCEHIVWNMTPFPFRVDAREIYDAARRFERAAANKVRLCDWCDQKAEGATWLCARHQQ